MRFFGFVIFVALCFLYVESTTSVFNYEISARVTDFLDDYTNLISSGLNVPYQIIQTRSIIYNLSDPIDSCRKLFWPVKRSFAQIKDLYIGFENKLFYGYIGVYLEINNSTDRNHRITNFYYINQDGTAGPYTNHSLDYDTTKRLWYTVAKQMSIETWVGPFLSLANNNENPTMALAIPLYRNITDSSGNIIAINQFYGVLSSNIYLADISAYLATTYQKTDRNIFIVCQTTGYLIATTFGAPLYYVDNKGRKVRMNHIIY